MRNEGEKKDIQRGEASGEAVKMRKNILETSVSPPPPALFHRDEGVT